MFIVKHKDHWLYWSGTQWVAYLGWAKFYSTRGEANVSAKRMDGKTVEVILKM